MIADIYPCRQSVSIGQVYYIFLLSGPLTKCQLQTSLHVRPSINFIPANVYASNMLSVFEGFEDMSA